MMPPSGAQGGAGAGAGHAYQTYQDFSNGDYSGGAGAAGGYSDGYDAAYDDEYPAQQPYPHPGIRGLQVSPQLQSSQIWNEILEKSPVLSG